MANGFFERGEVYWVRMDSGLGTEQGVGRPGLIVTSDDLNTKNTTVTIAFLSRKFHPYQTYVEVWATGEKSYVICNQLMSYDKSRLGKFCGKLNAAEQKAVDDALENVLDLGYQDDEALKEKDREIEARDAVIAEKDTEIQSLKDAMGREREAASEEVTSLKIEVAMWQRLYEKALNQVVDMKYTNDLFVRGHLGRKDSDVPPVAPPVVESESVEEPKVDEHQVDEPQVDEPQVEEQRVDINTCTITALKKLGFSLPMGKKIVESRPFSSVEDLKRVNGLKANLYRLMEPKLCCTPIEVEAPVEEPPAEETPVEVTVNEDPGFELVDINSAKPRDLMAIGVSSSVAYKITGYRNKNGPFATLEDMAKAPGASLKMVDRFRDYLTCIVPESEVVEPEVAEDKLSVNEATVTELMNVGFTKAAANTIVAYRRKNGPYQNVYDLLKLTDISGKTLRKLGDRVRV